MSNEDRMLTEVALVLAQAEVREALKTRNQWRLEYEEAQNTLLKHRSSYPEVKARGDLREIRMHRDSEKWVAQGLEFAKHGYMMAQDDLAACYSHVDSLMAALADE